LLDRIGVLAVMKVLEPPKMASRENAPEVPLLGQRLPSHCSLQAEPALTSGAFPGFFREVLWALAESRKTRD